MDSSQADGAVVPKYQFYLEVEGVVFPADGEKPENPEMVWASESFAVAKSKDSARFEEVPGYDVPHELQSEIMKCLTDVLLVDPERARVLPVSDYDRAKVGKRISAHPLHETFLGKRQVKAPEEFYSKVEEGSLVADLDEPSESAGKKGRGGPFDEPVFRVQRVFTTPLDQLAATWHAAAENYHARRK